MLVWKANPHAVQSVAFAPTGKQLASCSIGQEISLWELGQGTPEKEELSTKTPSGPTVRVVYSPDGRFVARGGSNLDVWDLRNNNHLLLSTNRAATGLAFSADSQVLLTHSMRHPTARLATTTWKILSEGWGGTRSDNDGTQFPLTCAVAHPKKPLVISAYAIHHETGWHSILYAWDREGNIVRRFESEFQSAHPTEIAMSPDGRFLAGVHGAFLRIWDFESQKELACRSTGRKHLKNLVFTADSRRLVTVSNDTTVRLWETSNWTEVGGYEWKIGKLIAVAASPDGLQLAAGSAIGKMIVWDVED